MVNSIQEELNIDNLDLDLECCCKVEVEIEVVEGEGVQVVVEEHKVRDMKEGILNKLE